ncbi:MAG: Hsp20/alpha crystallin family protein [Anaerolineales bacterium]|nr:Hsp20/alpha crystallin family protein [Anaerolineales bacterium]
MRLVRWNPARDIVEMQTQMDRLMDSFFTNDYADTERFGLAVDVAEDDDNFTITAAIPGVKAEDLHITLDKDVLTIQAETRGEEVQEGARYHLRERRYGAYSRSLRFPVPVNGDNITAGYEDGVLTVQVPKAEVVKPKRIAVNGAAKTIEATETEAA